MHELTWSVCLNAWINMACMFECMNWCGENHVISMHTCMHTQVHTYNEGKCTHTMNTYMPCTHAFTQLLCSLYITTNMSYPHSYFYTYASIYIYVQIHTHIHTFIHTVNTASRMESTSKAGKLQVKHTYTRTYIHTHTYAHTHTCIHSHMHKHTVHTHTHMSKSGEPEMHACVCACSGVRILYTET
jgi:hypothetical protein